MSWANVAIGGSALLSGILGSNAAGDAADAQGKASKQALELQRQQWMATLGMIEPQRYTGYQALADINSLYGYGTAAYTPLSRLQAGNTGGTINVGRSGSSGGSSAQNTYNSITQYIPGMPSSAMDPVSQLLGLGGGGGRPQFRGTINPQTGSVDVGEKDAATDATLTHYLRTGEWLGNKTKRYRNILAAIDQLRNSGWTWNADTNTGVYPGAVPATPPAGSTGTGTGGTSADGTAGNFGRFFASPDYNFRQQEGARAIDRSAAARGGALSGSAVRAQTGYASDLASSEYGNYVNRLLSLAGLGQTATTQTIGAGAAYANNAGGLLQAQGDARASGVLGQANSVSGALNGGLNAWLMNRYLMQQPRG